ncbi:MAG: GatB/YqeY domain-containing protein [Flavobacterium sp.]|nr:GatB/YqeY domain-containing protein [Flavobacterium sp.]
MSLEVKIMDHMKEAMKAKDSVALEALRAIKSAIILVKTEAGAAEGLSEADEIKMLQRLVKMRKDSYEIFTAQNRPDLAEPELAQIAVIEKFLPAQLSEAEVEAIIAKIIVETGATGIAAMGKIMGLASTQIGGQAEGKIISGIVKKLLV